MLQHPVIGDASRPAPFSRWDIDGAMSGAEGPRPPRFGVFLKTAEVESFDCSAFGVMRSEAVTMDPQQKLLLKASCLPTFAVKLC